MRIYVSMGCLMSALLLGACMPLKSSQPAPVIYALHGLPEPRQQIKKNILHVIAVREPEVPPGFNVNKIALYLYNTRRLDYYMNAAWPERLGKILQGVIEQSAQRLPNTIAADQDSGIPASYEIWIKVNDFEPVYAAGPDEPPQLKVSLNFRLLSLEGKKILLDETFSATAPAAENTQTVIISGLEALLRDVNMKAFREIRHTL